jgi:predicted signal transduction protein with EAL and GGDEF domain
MANIVLRFGDTGKAKAVVTNNQMTKAIDALAVKYDWKAADGAKELFVAKKCLTDILADAMIQEIRTRQKTAVEAVQAEEQADLGVITPVEET